MQQRLFFLLCVTISNVEESHFFTLQPFIIMLNEEGRLDFTPVILSSLRHSHLSLPYIPFLCLLNKYFRAEWRKGRGKWLQRKIEGVKVKCTGKKKRMEERKWLKRGSIESSDVTFLLFFSLLLSILPPSVSLSFLSRSSSTSYICWWRSHFVACLITGCFIQCCGEALVIGAGVSWSVCGAGDEGLQGVRIRQTRPLAWKLEPQVHHARQWKALQKAIGVSMTERWLDSANRFFRAVLFIRSFFLFALLTGSIVHKACTS